MEKQLKDTMSELMKDKTIIIVSHRFSTIRNADHQIVHDKNALVDEEPFREVGNESGDCFN